MNLSKDTAKRMLSNIDSQLKTLAAITQSMNGNKGGAQMGKGGRVKMQNRGKVPYYLNPNTSAYGNNNDTYSNLLNPLAFLNGKSNSESNPFQLGDVDVVGSRSIPPVAINPKSLAQSYAPMFDTSSGKYTAPSADMGTQQELGSLNNWQTDKIKFSNPLDNPTSSSFKPFGSREQMVGNKPNWNSLVGLMGPAFNAVMGMGIKNPKRLNPNDYQNPYESQALSMMPTEYNIEPERNEIRNQSANYRRDVNSASNSRGERMANYTSGMNRANEAYDRLYTKKFNQEQTMRSNKAQMFMGAGARRAGVNMQVADMDLANQAQANNMRRQYLGAAAEGVGNWSNVNKQMSNQKASQDAYIKALSRINPWMSQWLGLENYK